MESNLQTFLREQLQEDIITYFDEEITADLPFTFTSDDKESMVDDLCQIVINRIGEGE